MDTKIPPAMHHFRITSLPQMRFAHIFHADSYHRNFPARVGLIEITCITCGCLCTVKNGQRFCAHEGDVTCDLFEAPQILSAERYHEHHTVGFCIGIADAHEGEDGCLSIPYLTESSSQLQPIRDRIDEIIRHSTLFPEDELSRSGLILMLLAELNAYHRNNRSAASASSPHVIKAKQYISAHLHEPISQKKVAEALGITPEYLCAVFKKNVGESLIHYTNRRKLTTIAAIMQNEQIPLSEAAVMFGYSDPNYVSRLYRSYFGRTLTDALEEKLHIYDGKL